MHHHCFYWNFKSNSWWLGSLLTIHGTCLIGALQLILADRAEGVQHSGKAPQRDGQPHTLTSANWESKLFGLSLESCCWIEDGRTWNIRPLRGFSVFTAWAFGVVVSRHKDYTECSCEWWWTRYFPPSVIFFFIISAKFVNWRHFLDNRHILRIGEKTESQLDIKYVKETHCSSEVFKCSLVGCCFFLESL